MSIMRAGAFGIVPLFDRPLVERMRRFPREPGVLQRAIQSVAACSIRAWLRGYHRFEIVGRENLPGAGSFVMVANHASHLDALCLLSALPMARLHRTFPAAAADYFFESLPRLALSVFVINALPFDRGARVRQSLDRCRDLLASPGNILILFPEGTRSTGDRLGPFRPGIGMLLAGSTVPVVPCHLGGTHRALPKGAWFPRPRRVRLTIGKPLTFPEFGQDRDSIRLICEKLQHTVAELGMHNGCLADGHALYPAGSASVPHAAPLAENPLFSHSASLALASRGEDS
jgi:1-acyl-sn-glycerol-3-phosphate acyltransferase